jgi:dihydrofolate synthase / folylpolyglutamate synthase
MKRSLEQWLSLQQRQHIKPIDLSLDRVQMVWRKLGYPRPAPIVITVGGTNGKGSSVAYLGSILRASGRRVGAYTSPHLLHYRERVLLHDQFAADDDFVRAFEQIDAARGDVTLTYFEWGTLAAFLLMQVAALDVAILEVGLGGRLDAVNVIDADGALLTTVDLDHQSYLGSTRELIGAEKAPIFRSGKPAVYNDLHPVTCVLEYAQKIGTKLWLRGVSFDWIVEKEGLTRLRFAGEQNPIMLPSPALSGPSQMANAAACVVLLRAMHSQLPVADEAIARGIMNARVPGRLQQLCVEPRIVVDVAHNPQAAQELSTWIVQQGYVPNQCIALFGALNDKDVSNMLRPLGKLIARWHLCDLQSLSDRGLSSAQLYEVAKSCLPPDACQRFDHPRSALAAARQDAGKNTLIIVFGSFVLVEAVMRAMAVSLEPSAFGIQKNFT